MRRLLLILGLAAIAGSGCGGAECDSGPAGFSLVVNADMKVRTISVLLAIDGEKWRRTFDLEDTLADGETSLFVAVEPEPKVEFKAALLVEGYDENGRMTARGSGQFVATPDACNRFRIALDPQRKGKDQDDT